MFLLGQEITQGGKDVSMLLGVILFDRTFSHTPA